MNVLHDGEILLYGTVGEGVSMFAEGFTPLDVVQALAEIGRNEDVTVRINSGGGFVSDGVAIFNALESHRGRVVVVVEGQAASAGSVIAMAGDEIVMRTGSQMMVHDPAGMTVGTLADHAKTMEALEVMAASIADIYAERTGRSVDEIREEMREERWMTAQEAVSRGYADRIERGRAAAPTAFDYSIYAHAPQRLVALARTRGWTASAASTAEEPAINPGREDRMTVNLNEGVADPNPAEDETVTAEAAEATAPEASDAGDPPAPITASVDPASVRMAERQRAADIVAACEATGQMSKLAEYLASDKEPMAIVREFRAARAEAGEAEITTRRAPTAATSTAPVSINTAEISAARRDH